MPEYSIHQLKPENFDILIPLMKDCFGMDVNVDYFKWKFLQNPSGPVLGFYALSETGECAAYCGSIAETYVINGIQRTIYQTGDVMTHSRHRRKGLFEKLLTAAHEVQEKQGNLFFIGFGGKISTPGLLKFGWKQIFYVYFHFKPQLVCRLDNVLASLRNLVASMKEETVHLSSPDAIIPLIQNAAGPRTTILLTRGMEYIKWRLSNPRHQSHIIALKKDGNYVGYCIYYIEAKKLMLLDAYCASGSSSRPLFNALNKVVIDNQLIGIISFAQRKTNLSDLLLSNKFLINTFNFGPLHEHLPFTFYATKAEMETYDTPGHWSITALDHDAF